MHFPRHSPATCLLPQWRSEARQISKPRFAFLGLRAEGWPNGHLLFCAKFPNSRPETREMTILTAPWKCDIWSESPGSELLVRADSETPKLYSDWINSMNKLCHSKEILSLLASCYVVYAVSEREVISNMSGSPIVKYATCTNARLVSNEHRSPPLGASTSPDRFNRSHVSLRKVHCSKNPAVV